jgi:hypothetical protein
VVVAFRGEEEQYVGWENYDALDDMQDCMTWHDKICLEMFGEVDTLHVKTNTLSGGELLSYIGYLLQLVAMHARCASQLINLLS